MSKTKTSENKRFRICAKRILLTYSQMPESLTKEAILGKLKDKELGFLNYLIVEERHQDNGKLFYCLLESQTKFNIRNPKRLDILNDDKRFHANYQEAGNYKKVAKNIVKDDNYLTNFSNLVNEEKLSVEGYIIRVAPIFGSAKGTYYFLQNCSQRLLRRTDIRNASNFIESINQAKREAKLAEIQEQKSSDSTKLSPFQLSDFQLTPEIQRWLQNGCNSTILVVAGEGESGKTQLFKALADGRGWKMLIVNHTEGLKALTDQHNAILIDPE